MAEFFFDTSGLAKLYHPEVGTEIVDRIVQNPANHIRISRLAVVELPSVFAIKVRTKFITRDDAQTLLHQFRQDIVAGRFEIFGLRESELVLAELLLERYAFDTPLRSSDAIQLAIALALKAQGMVDHFVAADKALCAVATLEGFSVMNPEAV